MGKAQRAELLGLPSEHTHQLASADSASVVLARLRIPTSDTSHDARAAGPRPHLIFECQDPGGSSSWGLKRPSQVELQELWEGSLVQ